MFSQLPSRTPPTSDGYDGSLSEFPEIDFRSLEESSRGKVSTDYLTHSIQKHPATFIPQIPSYLIRNYAPPDGGVILDIFSGSGTTGVEAIRQGHKYIGVEVNPLSKLVSEVATHPLPKQLLLNAKEKFDDVEVSTVSEVTFPGRTQKEFWFESTAVRELEELRQKLLNFYQNISTITIPDSVSARTQYTESELQQQVWETFVLTFANVVFETSNADPGVSKAYKSPRMKEQINDGDHPPSAVTTFETELTEVVEQVSTLWKIVLEESSQIPESEIILGDARSVSIDIPIDVTISSPPYINAINYYRGSKLRLFWVAELLEQVNDSFTASDLRSSIIGSNSSASLRGIDSSDLPFFVEDKWVCDASILNNSSLGELNEKIDSISRTDYSDAVKKSYLVWMFFVEDMVESMTTVYNSLQEDGHFFFVVGENVVGGEFIETRKYLTEIGQYLGCFESSGLSGTSGFTHSGTAFDEITNRELFQSRNHDGGVIECEWVLAFTK